MKLGASVGLLLCCAFLGLMQATNRKKQAKKLLELRDDLAALKGELRLHRRPIGQAVEAACRGEQLRAAGQAMVRYPNRDITLAIEEQFSDEEEKEVRTLLCALFETLSHSDEEACREALDRCVEALDRRYDDQEQRRVKNEPLQRWGPLLAGSIVCILLW